MVEQLQTSTEQWKTCLSGSATETESGAFNLIPRREKRSFDGLSVLVDPPSSSLTKLDTAFQHCVSTQLTRIFIA